MHDTPNTTGALQPMDQGVMRSFKCNSTALKLNHIIDQVILIMMYTNVIKVLI